MPEPQKLQIKCPNCGTPYQANVVSIVDVGQNPELRRALLAGQLNVAQCPNCKMAVGLEVPLLYHDPAAEFLGVYIPPQANLPEMERQKMIGEMSQTLMRALPPEQRKGYFLNPRQFINRQSFYDAIMGTMGVTQEELDRQRRKMKLLEQAMVMVDDPKGLELLAKQHDADLDYEFFMLLSGLVEQGGGGDAQEGEKLLKLRERLLGLTTWGKRVARQEAAVRSLEQVKSPQEVVDRIIAADPDEVDAMAVAARPLLDYQFFQALTERMENARGAEKDRLKMLRDRLTQVTQQIDDATRQSFKAASELLREILNSPSPRSAVREHIEDLDDVFMAVLQLNLQEAQKQNAREAVERLQMVYEEIMAVAEEGMPPEVRLINDLLNTPYPDGTRSMLKQNQGQLTPEVLDMMEQLAQELTERQDAETAKRLRDIRAQAMLLA